MTLATLLIPSAIVGGFSAAWALLRRGSTPGLVFACLCTGPPVVVLVFIAWYLSFGRGSDVWWSAAMLALAVSYALHPYVVHRLLRGPRRGVAHALSIALSLAATLAILGRWPPTIPP